MWDLDQLKMHAEILSEQEKATIEALLKGIENVADYVKLTVGCVDIRFVDAIVGMNTHPKSVPLDILS